MRVGRALGTAMLPCLLVLTACSGSSKADDPAPPSTSATAAAETGDGQTAAPALDPAHAVEPPGERTGAIAYSDIIVNGSKTLDAATIAKVQRLKGVQDVEAISLAEVPIENQALTVAAVDPATYRNFTMLNSALKDVVWDRVAGGELAIRPALEKKLPIDEDDFLRLGSTDDAPAVHIGALAPLSPQIDAVVNDTWIPTLNMVPDNALLIRTGSTSPITLRTPIEKILSGTKASVQMTDVVAREGLDPDVVQTAVVVGTVADAVGTFRYTVLSGGHIAPDPAWEAAHITTQTVPILGSVTCNKAIFPQLIAALNDVQAQGLADTIHPGEYAGCYYPRFIAGTTSLSNHAFGLALDINAIENQRGTAGRIDRGVVTIFKRWGFTWGGDWRYTDPMHFEMNTLVNPQ
ncbi:MULTISPECIES: M15 family metallopeptidase [unclassified Nocardioides]|uniref:M15 family metallopeptidase n=1 Tax=unclassified Nocardioides TaxID=2615069 RepID=UPI0009F1287D|nr:MULTISPECIES: M15 family metallopeptidase [unclassified Nocardioides]GAW52389.1 uncharacterized protein (Precursor) [Nocardioides sp. PD653-B2]GAW53875.1 uncharacterized protein (Precursor) [Nocardioides sp. PD653]